MNLNDVSELLFKQLGRLAEAPADGLEAEIARSKALVGVSGEINRTAHTQLDAVRVAVMADDSIAETVAVPRMLLGEGSAAATVEQR